MPASSNVVGREYVGVFRNRLIEVNNTKISMGTLSNNARTGERVKGGSSEITGVDGNDAKRICVKCRLGLYRPSVVLKLTWKGERRRNNKINIFARLTSQHPVGS